MLYNNSAKVATNVNSRAIPTLYIIKPPMPDTRVSNVFYYLDLKRPSVMELIYR